jgi:glycosyltransferase involved in cell wall biosynthesis
MRVCLFTDTLGDVNGVSRFIRGVAERAQSTGRELLVATSTRFEVPDRANIVNFAPRAAARMPKYEHLELAWPPARAMREWAGRVKPDAVHVSTPGPVGMVGRGVAIKLGVPLLGVYHTDFPAYVEHLFEDRVCTWLTSAFMRWFYRPFSRVFTRTKEYAWALEGLGIAPHRIVALKAGIDVETFHPRHKDGSVWDRLGVGPGVKVLYVGRVSVEKNLPMLARAWKLVRHRSTEEPSISGTRLIVVGDGPYKAQMERELEGADAVFLGFRHGQELSAIYAGSDLFVFPSTTDTLGQVVMEAQASGLPVLVSDVGGPKEVVRDGETGFVLPAADARAWARSIAAMAADQDLRERMGAAADAAVRPMSIGASFEHFWEVHKSARECRVMPR